jgi:hypothetical protein
MDDVSHFYNTLALGTLHGRKQDGYQQQTSEHAAMRQHQGDDLTEHQRERSVLLNDFLSPIQGSVRRVAQWDLVWPQCS